MNFEKVIFAFFTILACTLNFGFFVGFGFFLGEIDVIELHHATELFAAIVINMIALLIKFGDRTQLGATHLATSLVATLQLVAGSIVWMWTTRINGQPLDAGTMSLIISLSGGALLANLISVCLLIGETLRQGR